MCMRINNMDGLMIIQYNNFPEDNATFGRLSSYIRNAYAHSQYIIGSNTFDEQLEDVQLPPAVYRKDLTKDEIFLYNTPVGTIFPNMFVVTTLGAFFRKMRHLLDDIINDMQIIYNLSLDVTKSPKDKEDDLLKTYQKCVSEDCNDYLYDYCGKWYCLNPYCEFFDPYCDLTRCGYHKCTSGKMKLLHCSRCDQVAYCNADCQKKYFPYHKKNCKKKN